VKIQSLLSGDAMHTTQFNGAEFVPTLDGERLWTQMEVIRDTMLHASRNEQWLTLREINILTQYPEASISAQLRNLKKARFGSWIMEKRRRGEPHSGCYEYIIRRPMPAVQEKLWAS
jgi:hypothetical protein